MSLHKDDSFVRRDVFIDYPYECVMFRWNHVEKKDYVRFYGKVEHIEPVPHDNKLHNDPILFGEETTREFYEKGRGDNRKI